jgi:hypothetical protein
MGDFGPERGSDRWLEQVDRMCKCFRFAVSKEELSKVALMYILDTEYSRSAITQALHDVEIEKGWH